MASTYSSGLRPRAAWKSMTAGASPCIASSRARLQVLEAQAAVGEEGVGEESVVERLEPALALDERMHELIGEGREDVAPERVQPTLSEDLVCRMEDGHAHVQRAQVLWVLADRIELGVEQDERRIDSAQRRLRPQHLGAGGHGEMRELCTQLALLTPTLAVAEDKAEHNATTLALDSVGDDERLELRGDARLLRDLLHHTYLLLFARRLHNQVLLAVGALGRLLLCGSDLGARLGGGRASVGGEELHDRRDVGHVLLVARTAVIRRELDGGLWVAAEGNLVTRVVALGLVAVRIVVLGLVALVALELAEGNVLPRKTRRPARRQPWQASIADVRLAVAPLAVTRLAVTRLAATRDIDGQLTIHLHE
eukprot:7391846-Prymnesium_polylepis.2